MIILRMRGPSSKRPSHLVTHSVHPPLFWETEPIETQSVDANTLTKVAYRANQMAIDTAGQRKER